MENPIVMLVLDNFRMGGIQRLALDQLFTLSDLGIRADAYFRQVKLTHALPNFLTVEKPRIREKTISIVELPQNEIKQIFYLARQIRNNDVRLVINHSLGAAVILRLASLIARKHIVINTFVHQLPSLSATTQRLKRFVYALASQNLYGYSSAVVKDWNSRIRKSKLPRFLQGKLELKLHRNGVYLGRLPKVAEIEKNEDRSRLVFIGREVAWKNLEFVAELLRSKVLEQFTALLVLPSIDSKTRHELETEFPKRVEFEIGKKIEEIVFRKSDINVYPVNYGAGVEFIEAVSLNCLEMACIGVPSLITKGGNQTWPELSKIGIIREVDWQDRQGVYEELFRLQKSSFSEEDIGQTREIIDVRDKVTSLLRS